MPPQCPEEAQWFATELQPHEPMLRAWLRSQFHIASEVDDVIQEAFVRVLRARANGEVRSPKALLFVTARNIVLMQMRHRQVARIGGLAENAFDGILDEGADVAAEVARSQELELLTAAIQSLPARCRQILTLRKIYGLSQREVAAEMGISEHTVEAQGTIALRKLGEFFTRHGLPPSHR
ncbi:MAG: RNA polymerase sigma factor [Candidatus Didemnitutus sp.]|nr:RNA polymerase sigma factor [Candidatus Didemnitutus sp.]